MDLTDEQKAQVATWVSEGATLSDVQKRLDAEFQVNMTFMEVRFLVDDLDLELKDQAPKPDADITKAPPPPAPNAAGVPEADQPSEASAFSSVQVSVDAVQRPGALVSGTVTFSDGESMGWQLDQMGRLGLLPGSNPDYRPSENDLTDFQLALQNELKKKGF